MKTAHIDYVTAHLKAGFPADTAMVLNNLWLACGLTHIVIGANRFELRVLEGT
jgi:hypothetical protein